MIFGTSVLALAGLCSYRWSQKSPSLVGEEKIAFDKIKDKVSTVYCYVLGGFALTASAAVAAHIGGISRAILNNRYLVIPLFAGSLASLIATIKIDKENVTAKHVAWSVFNMTMGMQLSPLGLTNPQLVAQAAAISIGLGSALTLSTFLAPDRRFLEWEGPLMTALTSITLASTIALFFPGSAFAYRIDRVSLYGGLAIFSTLLMSHTQRTMQEAETQTDREFDPIRSSLDIYLDGLNIFVRILRILLENKENETPAKI